MPRKKKPNRSELAKQAWRRRRAAEAFGKYPKQLDHNGESMTDTQLAPNSYPNRPSRKNFEMLLGQYQEAQELLGRYRKDSNEQARRIESLEASNDGFEIMNARLKEENAAQKVLLDKAAVAFVGIFSSENHLA